MLCFRVAVLALLAVSAPVARADTLAIEHSPVGCVVADKYPRFEARLTPADAVAKARVLFQTKGGAPWYAVAMRRDGPAFQGVLPKPKKSLKVFRYYIEATDRTANTVRTVDQDATVVDSAAGCQGKMMAGALGSAKVTLEAPAGAPTVPAGFAAGGIAVAAGAAAVASGAAASAGGGGFPTALVLGAAGAAAAGGAVIVAKGGGDDATQKTYRGAVNGTYSETSVCPMPTGGTSSCTWTYGITGNATVTLAEETGGAVRDVSGLQITGTLAPTAQAGGCIDVGSQPFNRTCQLTGSASALTCRQQADSTDANNPRTEVFDFSGALGGGGLSGSATITVTGRSSGCTKTGSGSLPVSLR